MPQPPRRRVCIPPQRKGDESSDDQHQRTPGHGQHDRPLQRLQQPRPLLAPRALERRQRQAGQRSDGEREQKPRPGRRPRHAEQRHEAIEQRVQAAVLPEGQQQRPQAQRAQEWGQPVPQPHPQERQQQRQDAGVEYELVVDAVAPVPRAHRLAEEIGHQQGQQVAGWPREAGGETVIGRSLPGRTERQLRHREKLHRRQRQPNQHHHAGPDQGKQRRPGRPLVTPANPGLKCRVGRQPQRHVDERGRMARQYGKPNRQPPQDGQPPRTTPDGAPESPQNQRQPGPGGDHPHVTRVHAHEEIATEGEGHRAEQRTRGRCPLRAHPGVHPCAGQPHVQHDDPAQRAGDRHQQRQPRRRIEQRRLGVGDEGDAGKQIGVPQRELAPLDRGHSEAEPLEEHVGQVVAGDDALGGDTQHVPIEHDAQQAQDHHRPGTSP